MGSPRGLLLPCLAFVVYVSLETTVGQSVFTSQTQHRGLEEFAASTWVALYLDRADRGTVVARALRSSDTGSPSARSCRRRRCHRSPDSLGRGPVAPAGLLVAGLALSVVFPLLMLLTPERVGAKRAAAAVGWQTAAASIGAAEGPAVAGVVLDSVGIETYGAIALGMTALLAALVVTLQAGRGVALRSQGPLAP